MKKRRVGTISMAIVLIGFGILLFIAQINKVSAVNLAMKFWPGILLLLGGEILWFSYKNKDEDIKITYDVFSIFIVLTILMFNIGLYGLMETGVLDLIKSKVSEQSYNYELPFEEYTVDESIEKIVIEGYGNSNLKVRTTDGNKIVSTGSISVNANSEENAKKILDENFISPNKIGNILYLNLNNAFLRELSITVPSNKKVEIKGGNELELLMDTMENDWLVDNIHRVKIRLNKNLNMAVNTTVSNEHNLSGNANWKDTKIGKEENHTHKGELIYGDGKNMLNILNVYEVIADEI